MSWYYQEPWHERARDRAARIFWCSVIHRHRWSISHVCKRCGKYRPVA